MVRGGGGEKGMNAQDKIVQVITGWGQRRAGGYEHKKSVSCGKGRQNQAAPRQGKKGLDPPGRPFKGEKVPLQGESRTP